MNELSKHISQMNNLKNKIISVSEKLYMKEHNIFQDKNVKIMTEEEIKEFIKLRNLLILQDSIFNITNVKKKEIVVEVIWPGISYFPYEEDTPCLKKETFKLKNIWNIN